jgi:dipeptidyl aminopeptidase/acylaminoacyl peptidase
VRVAATAGALVAGLAGLAACGLPNHHLVHPREPAAGVLTWSADFARDPLRLHVEGARPSGPGPFPAVLVHPEGGKTAVDMRGVIWDLAGRGYVALAADYRRLIDGTYRRNLFAWRSPADATMVLDVTRAYPEVDQARLGVLGFSQGAVLSLLIAAHAPERIRAVVAYYPVTDFPHWFALERPNPFQRLAYDVIRWYFRRESGAATEDAFEAMLREASPYQVAEAIEAPVLLVHGARDTTAPVEESQRMADRLAAAGRPVELLVVEDGVHLFNFRQGDGAELAWQATSRWLDRHVRDAGREGRPKRISGGASRKVDNP